MLYQRPTPPAQARRIVLASTTLSAGLFLGLASVYVVFDSRLALAQAADSFSDIFTASALLVSMHVAAQPPDESHPVGHHRAEPIAALVAAVTAGVLAVEVLREAVFAILEHASPEMGFPLVGMFAAKIVAKTGIATLAARAHAKATSPALHALAIDARNDVLVGLLAVIGFFGARYGIGSLDAWLALPIGLWIGASGISLARDNIGFLMGEAPPAERREALLRIAREVPGVRAARALRARYHGTELDVLVDVLVDPSITLREAHDIGHAVETRLVAEPDVCHAIAHVDVEPE